MTNKIEHAKAMIEMELEMKEDALQDERKQIIRAAEHSTADEIIAWANNMKETERRIYALKEQLKVIEFLEGNE